MPYTLLTPLVGVQQVGFNTAIDTTANLPTGTIVTATDPFWGSAEFMYVKASGTIQQSGVVSLAPTFDSTNNKWEIVAAEVLPTTAWGTSVGVAQIAMTNGQYGWMLISGLSPTVCTTSVAVGGRGLQLSTTTATLRSVVSTTVHNMLTGVQCRATSSTSVSKMAVANSSQTFITVNDASGWFPGCVLTGSGMATSVAISSIDSDNRTVRLTLATSGAVNNSVAAHYNNSTFFYNVLQLSRPVVIGASLGPITT